MQKSKSSASQQKKETDATINRLQTVCSKKLSARTISKQCGLASAHGTRGRKRAQRVNSGFAEAPSLSSVHTVCVCCSAGKFHRLSLPLRFPLSPASVASSHKLAHCSMDAQPKTFRWRMRFTCLLKPLSTSSSHQLSEARNLNVGTIVEGEKREREREGRNRL